METLYSLVERVQSIKGVMASTITRFGMSWLMSVTFPVPAYGSGEAGVTRRDGRGMEAAWKH